MARAAAGHDVGERKADERAQRGNDEGEAHRAPQDAEIEAVAEHLGQVLGGEALRPGHGQHEHVQDRQGERQRE